MVSHDRDFLDACIDYVLVLNRNSIEVQTGNFSGWWENKKRSDQFAQMENEKHLKDEESTGGCQFIKAGSFIYMGCVDCRPRYTIWGKIATAVIELKNQ